MIAFGLGSIHAEILAGVCFRITPLTDRDAAEMVREIRGFRLLAGYRGHLPVDVDSIERVLLRISRLVEAVPEITELDLNPRFLQGRGAGLSMPESGPVAASDRADSVSRFHVNSIKIQHRGGASQRGEVMRPEPAST